MVVTGVGVVSSIGTGVEAFWDALADGVSGAIVLELDGEPPTPVCRVKDFDGEALFGRRAPLSLAGFTGWPSASIPAMNSRMRGAISFRKREPLKTP